MDALVKLEGVSKYYGRGEVAVHALQEIELEIRPGELTALAGPSGSGKTTLLNMIGGLDRPSGGRVWVAGEDVTAMNGTQLSRLRLHRIGVVFQAYSLIPVLTAYENAEYVLMLQGVREPARRERVMAVLREVGLAGLETRFPRELSGGQQQRVAIARAIAPKPALILADEPTANVDSATAAALLDLMASLNEAHGVTFLFSTHDRHVMQRARRTITVRDGRIESNGMPGGLP